MSLPWHKVHNSLLRNQRYRRVSRGARLTFRECLTIASECDRGGVLAGGIGALTIAEINQEINGPGERALKKELDELVRVGLLEMQGDAYVVSRFEEFQERGSIDRSRRHRLKKVGLSEQDWGAIIDAQGGHCAFCPESDGLTIDHIIPRILGGADEPNNIQALCAQCNGKKHANLHDSTGQRIATRMKDGLLHVAPLEGSNEIQRGVERCTPEGSNGVQRSTPRCTPEGSNALDRDRDREEEKTEIRQDYRSLFFEKQEEPENLEFSQLRMRARGILDRVWRAMEDLVGNDLRRESWEPDNWRFALELAKSGRSDEEILAARLRASKRIGRQVIRLEIIRDQLIMDRDAMRNVTPPAPLTAAGESPLRTLTEEEREASDAARQRTRVAVLGRFGGVAAGGDG